jgi:N-acetylmuramoyl-L-alanine amidase
MMKRGIFFFFVLFLPLLSVDGAISKDRRSSPVASAVKEIGIVPTVVIDAGHGGLNLGAHVANPFCEEKRFTLMTARLVKKYLSQLGYRVVMTRATDTFVSLPRRVEIANHSHGDLFVSIHFNSSRNPIPQGVEIFFSDHKEDTLRSQLSRKLAATVLSRVIRRTKAASRGVKKADFYVIRETFMPSILVEGGFISNAQERSFLKDPRYIEKIARGIVEGVDHYFKRSSKG